MVITKKNKKVLIIAALLAILALATWLRFYNIENQGLWFDEILTAATSEKDLGYITSESNSWLHYVFVKIGQFFQYSVVGMKIPGIIAGVLSVLTLFFIGRELKDSLTGLVAALLGSLLPVHIYYSQEVRYYTYLLLFSSLWFFCLLKLYKTRKIQWGIAFFCSSGVLALTHYSGLILLSGFLVWQIATSILMFFYKIKGKKYINFNYAAFGCFLILILAFGSICIFAGQSHFYSVLEQNVKSIKLSQSVYFGTTYFVIPAKNYPWQDFVLYLAKFLSVNSIYGVILFSLVFLLGLSCLLRKKCILGWVCLVPLLLTILGPMVISVSHWWDHKYFLYYLPVWIVVISYGIVHVSFLVFRQLKPKKRRQNASIGFLLVFLVAFSLLPAWEVADSLQSNHIQKYDWQKVSAYMAEVTQPGDVIFLSNNGMSQISFLYFFNDGPGVPFCAGKNTAEEVGNFVYPQYFRKMNPRHLYNNNGTVITSYSLFLADSQAEFKKLINAHSLGTALWLVSINSPKDLGLHDLFEQELIDNIGGIGVYRIYPKKNSHPEPLLLLPGENIPKNNIKFGQLLNPVVMWSKDNIMVDNKNAFLENGEMGGHFVLPYIFKDDDKVIYPNEVLVGLKMVVPDNAAVKLETSANGLEFEEIFHIEGPIDSMDATLSHYAYSPAFNAHGLTYLRIKMIRSRAQSDVIKLKEIQFTEKPDDEESN